MTLHFQPSSTPPSLDPEMVEYVLKLAASRWSEVTGIEMRWNPHGEANIELRFGEMPPNKVDDFAHLNRWFPDRNLVTFNIGRSWSLATTFWPRQWGRFIGKSDLLSVALHELGHCLQTGSDKDHNDIDGSVMQVGHGLLNKPSALDAARVIGSQAEHIS